ncbi:hypothetical protein LNQ03_33205 [Klebsiella pneumoniae subsp. pneumoniae]|nr:hypothetical protein [Klebsiella pneumoniae subsp. pneumoniae]
MSLMAPFFISSALAEKSARLTRWQLACWRWRPSLTVTPYSVGEKPMRWAPTGWAEQEHHLRDDYRSGRCGTVHLRDPSQLGD